MTLEKQIFENDAKNLAVISDALAAGKINADAAKYISAQYTDSMDKCRQIFYIMGRAFGAPKAAVQLYNAKTNRVLDDDIKISDINPMSAYLVNHRLDMDPMRNQFFEQAENNRVDLLVSSIVGVIVAAQKSLKRALEKVIGKYYDSFVDEVANTAEQVLVETGRDASGRAIAKKIRDEFSKKFITDASETVLGIIGGGHEGIAVELVRRLDKITKPHLRLNDIWRTKCLFDMVPQARMFMEKIVEIMPTRIISIRDNFCAYDHPRNYRDAKIILNLGDDKTIVPLEIILQIRTFFDVDVATHTEYEKIRGRGGDEGSIDSIELNKIGVRKYNTMVCHCVAQLFDRIGWNVLYKTDSLFEGFPRLPMQYYDARVIDAVMRKVDVATENEVFYIPDAPVKLDKAQTLEIIRWMTRFILVSTVPYRIEYAVPGDTMPTKLFNFVMKELQRHYKK